MLCEAGIAFGGDSVTGRRNGRFLHYFNHFGTPGIIYVKWLKLDPYCLQQKCSPKNLLSGDILRKD